MIKYVFWCMCSSVPVKILVLGGRWYRNHVSFPHHRQENCFFCLFHLYLFTTVIHKHLHGLVMRWCTGAHIGTCLPWCVTPNIRSINTPPPPPPILIPIRLLCCWFTQILKMESGDVHRAYTGVLIFNATEWHERDWCERLSLWLGPPI